MVFIVLVELVRSVIRPLTLSVRLSANIMAGHLLFVLVGRACMGLSSLILILAAQFILFLLELAVSIIQGYVFVVLLTLYYSEVV